MTQDSYLGQIARRAVQGTPGLLPPRRLVRALPATPMDRPVSPPRVPVAASSGAPAADPIPPHVPTPIGAPPSVSVEPETQPEPAALAVIETSSSPSGAGAGVIPGDASPAPDAASETRPIDRMQQRPGSEPLAVASASGTEPMATPPIEPRRPMAPRRNIAVAPDPLAVALAAAVRWTSSDDERPDPNAVAPRQRERPGAPAFVPPRETHRREAPAPPGDAPPRVVRAPRAEVVAAKPDHRPAPAPAAERFAGVHIGSVEVQILSPTPVQPPVARPPAVPSAAPATPLARGLTSAIGLLQS